jgi:hypothetical protein
VPDARSSSNPFFDLFLVSTNGSMVSSEQILKKKKKKESGKSHPNDDNHVLALA